MEKYENLSRAELVKKIVVLEEAHKKFQSLKKIISAVDGLFWKAELSSGGKLINTYASHEVFSFLKIPKEQADNTFDVFFEFVHPEDREKTREVLFLSLKTLKSSFHEYKMLLPDGTIKWVRSVGKVNLNKRGNPEAFGITLDISEWKNAQKKLEISRQNYKNLFDYSPNPIVIHKNGVFVALNRAALDFAGKENQNDLLGRSVLDFVHPAYRVLAVERMKEVIAGNVKLEPAEEVFIRSDGRSVNVETFPAPITFNGDSAIFLVFRDISDRKKAFLLLKENEARFRAFTEGIQAAVFTFDSSGCFSFVNKATTDITGYSADELKHMHITSVAHGKYKELIGKNAEARLRGEDTPAVYDIQIKKKDGTIRWVQWANTKVQIDGVDLVLGSAIDVHDRKMAEAKLMESEEQFRNLFEHSSDPMMLIRDGVFFACNKAAMESLKAEHKEQVLIPPYELSPEYQPDGVPSKRKAIEHMKEVFKTGFTRFEWVHRDLEGNDFWCDISLTLMPEDDNFVIHTIWRDITVQKQMASQIMADKEQLSVTLKSIGDAVITTNLNGKIQIMNRIAENLTGWTEAEARGRNVNEVFCIFDGATGNKVENPLINVIRTGSIQNLKSNTLLVSKNGTKYQIDDSAAPIRDKDNLIIGGVLVFRDVTQSHKMQAEVMKLRKLDSVGRLAGGIAHDFNNLLTGILGNINFASKLVDSESQVKKYLDIAESASQRATELTKRLLTFSKGGEPIKQTASIHELVKDSAEFVLSGTNIKADIVTTEDLWNADIDSGQISQVIQNLIINAKQAMPDGGTISIQCENADIHDEFTPMAMGKYILIRLRDEGGGIAPDLIGKIFDPFFTTKEEGSGLGLSVIHSIVKQHHGYIQVESEVGTGTTFSIYLPASDQEVVQKEMTVEPVISSTKTYRILVLDDVDMICETLVDILSAYGHHVDAVSTGTAAVEVYRKEPYDILILDLTIPGDFGGDEVVRQILEFDPDVRAIVSSGFSSSPIMANYQDYGFKGVVSKPYRLGEMQQLITDIMQEG